VNGNKIDNCVLNATAANKNINFDLNLVSDTSSLNMNGELNFLIKNVISYKMIGEVDKLNLYTFVKDSTLISDLNFKISAEGDGFNEDSLNLYLTFLLKNSTINKIFIDSTRAIADIRRDQGQGRVINLISDLADLTITGKFTIAKMVEALSNEFKLISRASRNKIDEILPTSSSFQMPTTSITPAIKKIKTKPIVENTASMKYLLEFKDFSLLSLFLGHAQIEINGEMSGELRNSRDSIYFSYNTAIDKIKYHDNEKIFFLSNLKLDLNVSNSHQGDKLEDIFGSLHLKTDRVFAGADINDIQLDINLKNNLAGIKFYSSLENSFVKLDGVVDVSHDNVKLLFDTLNLNYNGFNLINKQKTDIEYARNDIDFRNFVLQRGSSELIIKGKISRYNNQNLNITLKDFKGSEITNTLMNLQPESIPEADINCLVDITGSYSDPKIKLGLNVDSITYKKNNFGSFKGDVNYLNKNLEMDFKFISQKLNPNSAALEIKGNLPINLAFSADSERINKNSPIDFKLSADNFNLAAFGDLLPMIKNLRGILKTNFEITGSINDLKPNGFIDLSKVAFLAEANNIEYYAEMKVTIQEQNLKLENLVLQNNSTEQDGGKITGSGTAEINGFKLVSSDFNINGDLKVLSENSKSVSPTIYGDLVIATNGNLEFKMNEEGAFLKAPIIVKKATLTFPPSQGAYSNKSSNFIYKYAEDSLRAGKNNTGFESLVNYSKKGSQQRNSSVKKNYFNYSIDVTVEEKATIIFVLFKELNQDLTAVLKGNLLFERIDGKSNAQGELTLLEGSTLEFFKTFQAEGSISFISDLTNPNLHITATYHSYYIPSDSTTGGQEVPVAVKIKINGPLKDLEKNFVQEENNIAVYYGTENIDNDIPDPTKDVSDAFYFLTFGRFQSEMTSQDKSAASNQLSSTATSVTGSILGGVLNNYFGSYVQSLEIRKAGSENKFNLSGNIKKFRYSIGGSTDVFQDLSQANVKIEYPIIRSLLIRLERKQAITETTSSNEMINELGLKYRFEF
jgi:hypothetical protein